MNRSAILSSLIQFDAPVTELQTALATITWDSAPTVVLARRHFVSVLQRFARHEINADAVEAWANLIEGREDIDYERGHEQTVADVLYDLANPQIQGSCSDIAPCLVKRLIR